MTYVDGYSISKKERIVEEGYDLAEVGGKIVRNYVRQVPDVGPVVGENMPLLAICGFLFSIALGIYSIKQMK